MWTREWPDKFFIQVLTKVIEMATLSYTLTNFKHHKASLKHTPKIFKLPGNQSGIKNIDVLQGVPKKIISFRFALYFRNQGTDLQTVWFC